MVEGNNIICIDGPSGAGKGTTAIMVAHKLGFHYLDSGALYRLTALAASEEALNMDDESAIAELARHLDIEFKVQQQTVEVYLKGEEVSKKIRNEQVAGLASQVAAMNSVRAALLERQRDFACPKGLVADGRDMGTVVFPNAPVKIFLTASAEERAQRRYKQLINSGNNASLRALIEDIRIRDERDSTRSVAPLKPADDAFLLDSTHLSINEVCDVVLEKAQQAGLFL